MVGSSVRQFRILEELGRGGMGVVYKARDSRLDRVVALKFLPTHLDGYPDAKQRFEREARAAAALDHSNICTVFEIGDTDDGRTFIAMPLYEGETLEARLTRGAVAVEEAIDIGRQVADGLAAAHSRGIIHRDIKPANLFLTSDGRVKILDFGVAKLTEETAITRDTSSLGTVAYMSPEQTTGANVDHRTDLWSLGVVLFEMIVGERPFGGSFDQAVLYSILNEEIPDVGERLPDLPDSVARIIGGLLQRDPSDRIQTGAEVVQLLTREPSAEAAVSVGDSVAALAEENAARRKGALRTSSIGAALVTVTVVVVTAVAAWFGLRRGDEAEFVGEASNVAILPFRVAGADASLHYLQEGMVDLLAIRLTGDVGPQAVDPATTIRAWRATGSPSAPSATEARRIASATGAGRLLMGSVVGNEQQLHLTASILDPSGASRADASATGNADSLITILDRLVAGLLASESGLDRTSLTGLTSTSLPATKTYLEGQALYRRGRFDEAGTLFARALELDSTFALAALGWVNSRGWTLSQGGERAFEIVWRVRDRLNPRDRALVEAGRMARLQFSDRLEAYERLAEAMPGDPLVWYRFGDRIMHEGALAEIQEPFQRARRYFEQAVSLDSNFASPILHLLHVSPEVDEKSSWARMAMATDTTGGMTPYVRWELMVAAGDTAGIESLLAGSANFSQDAIANVMVAGSSAGYLVGLDAVADALRTRVLAGQARFGALREAMLYQLNSGRPVLADQILVELGSGASDPLYVHRQRMLNAMFSDGVTAGYRHSVAALTEEAASSRTPWPDAPNLRGVAHPVYLNECTLKLWRVQTESVGAIGPRDLQVRRREPEGVTDERLRVGCGLMLDALRSVRSRGDDAVAKVRALDAYMAVGPPGPTLRQSGNLLAARLLLELGLSEEALAASRRRRYYEPGAQASLSSYLRVQWEAAHRLGRTEEARRALAHLVTFRSSPEEALADDTEMLRKEHRTKRPT